MVIKRMFMFSSKILSFCFQLDSSIAIGFGQRCPYRFYCQCGGFRTTVEKVMGIMRRLTTVVAMVARCRVDYVHVLTKDSAVTGAQLYQNSSCLPWLSVRLLQWAAVGHSAVLKSCFQWQFWPHLGGCCWWPTCSWCCWLALRRSIAGCHV